MKHTKDEWTRFNEILEWYFDMIEFRKKCEDAYVEYCKDNRRLEDELA